MRALVIQPFLVDEESETQRRELLAQHLGVGW